MESLYLRSLLRTAPCNGLPKCRCGLMWGSQADDSLCKGSNMSKSAGFFPIVFTGLAASTRDNLLRCLSGSTAQSGLAIRDSATPSLRDLGHGRPNDVPWPENEDRHGSGTGPEQESQQGHWQGCLPRCAALLGSTANEFPHILTCFLVYMTLLT